MEELRVSATDFRVHLKDLGNEVARGKAAVVVSRHGLELGVFVNLDEYAEFLQWRNQQSEKDAAVIEVPSEQPESMPLDEVQRVYEATAGATDERSRRWRNRAYLSIWARTRKPPTGPPSFPA